MFLSILVTLALGASPEPPKRPNVLFLFTDDQRADTIHALGNRLIQTPNIDRLVRSGFAFRNAYCMGGDRPAVCLPSRTMMISGRSLFHIKQSTPQAPNFPRSFNDAGYVTYHHGKRGNTPLAIQALFQTNRYLKNDEAERKSGRPGQEIADAALDFLGARPKDKPFFMYLAFGNPHDPRVVVEEDRRRYDEATMPLPPNYLPEHPFDNGELKVRDEALAPWPRTPAIIRKELVDYYGVITHMDRQIGRILDRLKADGDLEKTIIIFSSDHGLAMGSHGLMGKQNIYEDGMKAPLIFSGPGIPQGESQAFAYLHDIFPTACRLAGLDVPDGLDGKDLTPVMTGHQPAVRDRVMLAYRSVQRSIRVGDWKLIRYPKINRTQLFDLKSDPHETRDLSSLPEHSARIVEMSAQLAAEQKHSGDPL